MAPIITAVTIAEIQSRKNIMATHARPVIRLTHLLYQRNVGRKDGDPTKEAWKEAIFTRQNDAMKKLEMIGAMVFSSPANAIQPLTFILSSLEKLTNGDEDECNDKGEYIPSSRIITLAVPFRKKINSWKQFVFTKRLKGYPHSGCKKYNACRISVWLTWKILGEQT